MARKPKQDLLDFSRNRPSWADRLIERDKNAESKVDAAIKSLLESGEVDSISEEQRQDMIRQVTETGDFDLAIPVEQPVTEQANVVLPTTEPTETDRSFRGFPSPLLNTITSAGSLANETEALANVSKRIQSLKAEQTGSSLVKQVLRDTVGIDLDDPEIINPLNPARGIAEILSPQLRKQRMEQEQAERETEIQELTTAARSLQERIAGRKEELPSVVGYVAEKVGQASGNPESYLATIGAVAGSSVGGPAGTAAGSALFSIPAAKAVYDSSLNEALELGATQDEAIQFAYGNTAIEFGTESVLSTVGAKAAGFFGINKLAKGPLRTALVKKIQGRGSRAVAGVGSEAFQEAVTTRAQDELAYQAEENEMFSDPAAREKLRIANAERKATEVERMLDAAASGAFGAGPTVGVIAAAQYGAEIATQEQGTKEAADAERNRLRGEVTRRDAEITQDIAREEERLRTEQAKEDAFRQAEEDRARQEQEAARQKEIEEEAGQRTIELERQFQGQTRVDRAPGITERVPVNPPAEITPEQVEQERVAEEQAAVDAARQKEQAGLLDEIQKRQKVRKSIEGRGARLAREKAEKEEKARRRKVLDDLIKENPDADPAQLLPLYQQRIAEPTQPATQEAPAATPATQTAPVARPAAPAVEGQVTTDTEIENMRKGLGLNMETTAQKPATTKESEAKRNRVISGIVRANKNKTADVQNLIRQGKIVVAANPEEIGRTDSGVGTYDSATGTMYLYTDRVDENNLVNSALQAALHEPVHAGQFNEREARSQVMQTLMSPESNSRVNQTIRTAARNGNTIAQAVVEDARKAAESNPNFMGDVESLELAPYLATRVEQARGKPLGQIGGAVRDVLSNARNFLRERTGLDLDITIGDLATATQQAAGEIVNTELTPEGEGTLEMIGGRNARGFDRAREAGQTFTEEADGRERFEIPDYQSNLIDPFSPEGAEAYTALLDSESLELEEFLDHERLYENYPTLKTMKISVRPLDVYAQYNGSTRSITLDRNQVVKALESGDDAFLRNLVLHEVQHAVQDIEGFASGSSKKNFMPRGVVNAYHDANGERQHAIEQFDVNKAISELPFDLKKAWDAYAKWANYQTVKDMAVGFMTNQTFINGVKSPLLKQRAQIYYNATENFNAAVKKYNDAQTKAYKKYLSDLGEAEARNTEERSRMTPEEIMASPARETLLQDPASRSAGLTRDDLIDSNAMRRAGQRLSDNEPIAPELRNEDGSPKTFYHGTSSRFDRFDSSRSGTSKDSGWMGKGFYFTDKLITGEFYSQAAGASSPIVREVALYVRNPYYWGKKSGGVKNNTITGLPRELVNAVKQRVEGEITNAKLSKALTEELQSRGYDGVIAETTGLSLDEPALEVVVFSPYQAVFTDISNSIGNDNFSDSAPLNMAATMATPTRMQVPKSVRAVFNLFDHALGVGKDFNELIEFASSSPAEARMIAERSLHTYNDTLAKEATKRGMSPAELNEQIQKELDAAVKETSGYNENYAAFKSVTDKYGKPGQAMLDMRNQIDALTKDIIQARLSKGTPLSAKEKKLYETLINNLGRYTHRQYATNAGKIGDKFSKMVWDDYQKVKEAGGQGKAKQLANYKRVANAVKYLVDNNLYIPDAEGLANMTAERTEHLYDVWGVQGNPRNLNTEQMKAALADARDRINGDTNRMEAVAEEITKELIGLSDPTKSLVTYFRGGKQENTILRERQNIPVELRELMGEIKDPAMRMMLTVAKQAEFVARNKMLLEIADNVGPQVQPPDAIGTPAVQGLEQVKGEGWGPLEGYYVSKELKNRLNDAILQLANFEQAVAMAGTDTSMLAKVATNKVVEGWGKVAGTTKALQIIGKPVNFLYNYIGAYRQLVMNGNVDPRTWGKAHKAASELIAYAVNPRTASPLAVEANKYGITDSAFIGELRSGQYKELQKLVKEMAGMNPSEALATVRKVGTFTKELYAMMDVWSKLANFYHEVDVLTNYYKAAGVNKTTEQIKREAADRANRTNITYKRAAPLVKGLEKMGITAFGTYFYEVFRSELGNAYQGVQDLRTAAKAPNAKAKSIMAGHAVTRLTGQAASWALTGYISKALAEAAFGDEDDDQDKRYLLPEYLRNKDFISLGRNENGEAVLFDWSRIDPAGPMTDIMRSIMHDDADLNAIADNFMQLYVAPRVGSQLITAVWASLDAEKKARGNPFIKQVAPEAYKEITDFIPGEDRTDKAWVNVVETFLPGIVSGYKDNNVVPVPEDLTSIVADSMTYGGATMYKLDPRRQAQSAVIEYDTAKRLARRDFGDLLKDYPEGLSQAELADKLGSAMQRERETFTDLVNVMKGMRAIGMTDREISVMLKDLRLAAGDITKVKKQQFESAAMTGDTIKTKMKQEMIGKTPKEKEEIKEKWDNIRLMIEGKN